MSSTGGRFDLVAMSVAAGLTLTACASSALAQSSHGVTIVVGEEPDDMDPCSQSSSFTGRVILQNVVETLAELRPDGSLKPRLATDWEQTDPLTWRFKIRDGVSFHDGARLNADTVIRALERVTGAKFNCAVRNKYFNGVKVAGRKVDDYTVEFTTEKPWPIMPLTMSGLPIASPNTPMDKLQVAAVGTGPYVFDHWNLQHEIVLKKNPAYWNKSRKFEVELARYNVRKDSPARASLVATGEADLAPSVAAGDADNPKLDVAHLNAQTTWLRIDVTQPPLDDRRVRQALNYAIDRKALAGRYFARGSTPATQAWGPNVQGHNFEIDKRVWPYDPAKARQLLAEAKAAGTRVDAEIELQGRIAAYDKSEDMMEAVAQYYKAVGFNVKLKMYELAQWRKLHNKPFPEPRLPALLQVLHENATGDAEVTALGKHACEASTGTLCDRAMDRMIEAAAQLKGEQRAAAFQEVARASYEVYVDNVYLVHMVGFARVGTRIKYAPNVLTAGMLKIEDITFN